MKLKPIYEINLVAICICVQIVLGAYIRRNWISEDWDFQFSLIVIIIAVAQALSLVIYFYDKYDDKS